MIDVHAHFAEEGYTFPEEWEKIQAAGVDTVILAGDNVAHSRMHRDFCLSHDGAYFCAGIHPLEANTGAVLSVEPLRELLAEEKCVALGEVGLDYHYPETNRAAQRELFLKQILLAEEFSLPVQIHSRDSAADMLAILREMKAHLKNGFLLHCYSHGADMLPLFADLGSYFSFGGVTCFKNAKSVWESVQACPMDRILSETDSPYLSPVRGEKNTPANIPMIVNRLAELKGVTAEEIEHTIKSNAERLFFKLK
ncbi:MAG: TatD family hydrolase [Clostridiales bacterium]|nr:TatD family hydrolase [Clostridiales bacterium]